MADDKQKQDQKGVGAAVGTGAGGQQQGQKMPGHKQDDQSIGQKGTQGSQPYDRDRDQDRKQQQPPDKKGGYESERR
jgi:hypothetical protein